MLDRLLALITVKVLASGLASVGLEAIVAAQDFG